jgi:HEAT repeat protein
LEGLALFGSRETAPFIRPLLSDPAPSVRESAANALAELGDRESAGLIAKLLDDSQLESRKGICRALGLLGAREVAGNLQALIGQGDSDLEVAAIQALAMLGARESIPAILSALDRSNGPSGFLDFDTGMSTPSAALGRFPEHDVAPELLSRLKKRYAPIRAEAAAGLGAIAHREAIAELVRLLEDFHPSVRKEAARSLGRLGAKEAIGPLRRILDRDGVGSFDDLSPDSGALSAIGAIHALTRLGATEAAPEFMKALRSVHEEIRELAFGSIGRLRLKTELPEILKLVADRDLYGEDGIPLRPEGRGRVPGNLSFGGVWAGTTGPWGSVFMPDLVAAVGGDEYVPDLVRMLPWLSSSERLSVAADLARLGSREGVPIILRTAEWGDGSGLWALNALRKPELWSHLRDSRFKGTRAWRKRELWAELGTTLGTRCEAPRQMLWGWSSWIRGTDSVCDLSYASTLEDLGMSLEVIRSLCGSLYSFILEDDRIRVVTKDEALAFWREWRREETQKRQDK